MFEVGKEFQMKLMIDETFVGIHFESFRITIHIEAFGASVEFATRHAKIDALALHVFYASCRRSFQHRVGPCRTQKHPKSVISFGTMGWRYFCGGGKIAKRYKKSERTSSMHVYPIVGSSLRESFNQTGSYCIC